MTNGKHNTSTQTARKISYGGSYKTISFEAVTAGLVVRTTDDGHLLALDFISTLTNGDRKKASQTLARVASRHDTSVLLTLRRVVSKPKPRKLLSFSNAIQLLLVLPKRTVCMETRRAVAGILTDYYEYRHQSDKLASKTTTDSSQIIDNGGAMAQFSVTRRMPQFPFFATEEERNVTLRQAQAELTHREMELERQRMQLPLERLNQCMELMERCGPMSEEDQCKFRCLISEQACGGGVSDEEKRKFRRLFPDPAHNTSTRTCAWNSWSDVGQRSASSAWSASATTLV